VDVELEPRIAAPAHATGVVEFVPLPEIAEEATFRLREAGDIAALAASIGRLGQLAPIELRPLPGAGDEGPRFQVVAGFRRLAALRMLQRGRVLARVHAALGDEDAWGLALGQALLTEPLDREALQRLRERLAGIDEAGWAEELLDEALVRAPVEPELRERFFEFLASAATPPAGPVAGAEPGEGPDDEDAPGDASPREIAPRPVLVVDAGEESGTAAQEVTPEELVADLGKRLYEVNADLAVAFESWFELPEHGRREILEQVRWLADLLPQLDRMGDGR
jgi:hypothetical protein